VWTGEGVVGVWFCLEGGRDERFGFRQTDGHHPSLAFLSLSVPVLQHTLPSRHQTNYRPPAQGIITTIPLGHSPTTRPERSGNKLSVSSGLSYRMILVSFIPSIDLG
jgi:hypothetical protein